MTMTTGGQIAHPSTTAPVNGGASIAQLLDRLQDNERSLIQHRNRQIAPSAIAQPEGPATKNVEFGNLLFLLHHKDYAKDEKTRAIIDKIGRHIAQKGIALPPTALSVEDYERFETVFTVLSDGTIIGTGKYEELDPGWAACLWNVIVTHEIGGYFGRDASGHWNPLGVPGPDYAPIAATSASGAPSITVGLLSDWGAGAPDGFTNASNVIGSLDSQKPDYIVHLGDVYYAGTPTSDPSGSGFWGYHPLGEESSNLLSLWPSLNGRSFALNSNHEMYSGAYGLFNDVLDDAGPFDAQGKFSVFAIEVGGWTLLGLDTAYASDMGDFYMYGAIGPEQLKWVAGLGLDAAKTIVLTHHTGLDYNGGYTSEQAATQSYLTLWSELNAALGGDPYAWYWGHVHNGVVYNTGGTTVTVPTVGQGSIGTRPSTTYCRCIGHGALPFASAPGLVGSSLPFYVKNDVGARLASNGYVTLRFDLDAHGRCETITEEFWDWRSTTSKPPVPLWTNTLYGAPTS